MKISFWFVEVVKTFLKSHHTSPQGAESSKDLKPYVMIYEDNNSKQSHLL